MTSKNKFKAGIISLYCFIIILATFGIFLVHYNIKGSKTIDVLNDGWSFYFNGELCEHQPSYGLQGYTFPSIEKGDEIQLTYTLQQKPYANAKLIFYTWHSLVDVTLDDTCIYSNGYTLYENNEMVGEKRHVVYLPNDYANKEIAIKMVATANNSMANFDPVGMCSITNGNSFWFDRPIELVLTGLILMSISFGLLIFGYEWLKENYYIFQACMLAISFFIGSVYLLCRGRVVEVLLPNPRLYNDIEYLSLFVCPIPMALFAIDLAKDAKHKWMVSLYRLSLCMYSVFVVVAFILHQSKYLYYCDVLQVQLILLFFLLVNLFIVYADRFKNNTTKKKGLAMYIKGMYSIIYGVIIAVICYKLVYIPSIASKVEIYKFYDFILPITIGICIIYFIKGFSFDMKDLLVAKYRNELLNDLAYKDALTGLGNRFKLQIDIEKYVEEQKGATYAIVSFDVNDLKKVNDTYGHGAGDELLLGFSRIASSLDNDYISTYRVGGDEFMMFVQEDQNVEAIVKIMVEQAKKFQLTHPYALSFAYGIAYANEATYKEQIYALSDARMYECKRKMKGNDGIR